MVRRLKKSNRIILNKNLIFYASLLLMTIFSLSLIDTNVKVLQREMIIRVDLENRVNICQPKEEIEKKIFRKSFFGF